MDTSKSNDERMKAFWDRSNSHWTRSLKGKSNEQMKQMVREFQNMGVVETYPGIADDPNFPSVMMVESLPEIEKPPVSKELVRVTVESKEVEPKTESERRLQRITDAGWESEEVANSFIDVDE